MDWKGLLYENGSPSLTRGIAIVSYLAFILASFYLLFSGKTWTHYSEFASLTGGGGALTQIANKFINSRYNSLEGEMPNKGGNDNG